MAKKKVQAEPLTDETLQSYMKDTMFYRNLENYFKDLDKKYGDAIKIEFERRGIVVYLAGEVQGDITIGKSRSPNIKKMLEEYSFEELHKMGVLSVDLDKFQGKAKKTDEEMPQYYTLKSGKKQLNIRPTEAMSEEVEKRIMEKIYDQLHKKFGK